MAKAVLESCEKSHTASWQFHDAKACAQYTTLPEVSGTDAPPLPAHARDDQRRAVPGFSTAGLALHFMRLVDSD
jgi:hypothetical protein